jgi:hypothetical protein
VWCCSAVKNFNGAPAPRAAIALRAACAGFGRYQRNQGRGAQAGGQFQRVAACQVGVRLLVVVMHGVPRVWSRPEGRRSPVDGLRANGASHGGTLPEPAWIVKRSNDFGAVSGGRSSALWGRTPDGRRRAACARGYHARFAAGRAGAATAACNLDAADPSATRVAHRRDGGWGCQPIHQRAEVIRCDRCGRLVRRRRHSARRRMRRCRAPGPHRERPGFRSTTGAR